MDVLNDAAFEVGVFADVGLEDGVADEGFEEGIFETGANGGKGCLVALKNVWLMLSVKHLMICWKVQFMVMIKDSLC